MTVRNKPFFEVLIGTYNRPHRAIEAIESVLSLNDVSVRCNSNGYEPFLEDFCIKNNVIYTFFEDNRGAYENWNFLLKNAESEFCMLLSDEDEIDPSVFSEFLKYLNKSDVSGAIVPFFDREKHRIFNRVGRRVCSTLSKKYLIYQNYSFRGYMSGFVFRTKFVQDGFSGVSFGLPYSQYDVYPHTRLLRDMLNYGNVLAINTPIVVRKPDVGYGGDSHAHVGSCENNPILNPEIYSVYSRIRQHCIGVNFLYQEKWSAYERLFIHFQIFMRILATISKGKEKKGGVYSEVKKAQIDSNLEIKGIDKLLPSIVYFYYVRVSVYYILILFFRIIRVFSVKRNSTCCSLN
jgi:glycosyltransferase involved in cell wall biosynthesis